MDFPGLAQPQIDRIDVACDRFEAEWRSGLRPRIEDYIAEVDAEAQAACLEYLLRLELELRSRARESPTPEEYQERFPEHSSLVLGIMGAAAPGGGDPDPDETPPHAGTSSSPVGLPSSSGPRFRLLRPLARGGLGEVLVARDAELDREVALKEIRDCHADDPGCRSRFTREARITGRLEHPGIIPVYGFGQHPDGRPFYAMRFVRGTSLKEAIERFHAAEARPADTSERGLEFRKLLGRFTAACHSVAYAHSRGVVHRDLKPANIMLGPFGETLVIDWGLAKAAGEPEVSAAEPLAGSSPGCEPDVTLPGQVVGTPQYMSPEQAAGKLDRIGPASDVYSVGATLYCLLTGLPPFQGDSIEVLEAVRRGEFPPPRRHDPTIDRGLEAICLKAMARTPEGRYASPTSLVEDVEHWLADEPVSAYPERWTERFARWQRRHRAWARAGAAASVIVTVVSTIAMVLILSFYHKERSANSSMQTALLAEREAVKEEQVARQKERRQRILAQARLARIDLDRGIALCQKGDVGRGMLWLARGLEEVPEEEADPDRLARRNLDAWFRRLPILRRRVLGEVPRAAFSPDGRFAVIVESADHPRPPFGADVAKRRTAPQIDRVRLWDIATGKPVDLELGCHSIFRVRPDGRVLVGGVIGGGGRIARMWTVPEGRPFAEPLDHPERIHDAAFNANGNVLVTVCDDGSIRRWDAATGRLIGPPVKSAFPIWEDGPFRAKAVLSDDARFFLVETDPGSAQVVDTETGRAVGEPLKHRGHRLTDVTFGVDSRTILMGAYVAIGSLVGDAGLWETASGRRLHTYEHVMNWKSPTARFPARVNEVSFSADGSLAATGGEDCALRLWDTATGRPVGPPLEHKHWVHAVALTPDGKTALSGGYDHTVRLWDTKTNQPIGEPLDHQDTVVDLSSSPDGRAFMAGTYSMAPRDNPAQAWLWEMPRHRPLASFAGGPSIDELNYTSDGTRLIARSDGSCRLWDPDTGLAIGEDSWEREGVRPAAFSPDGRTALVRSGGELRLLNASGRGDGRSPLRQADRVSALAYSPDGRTLAVAGGRVVLLRDATTLQPRGGPLVHTDEVYRLAFRPDGLALATVAGSSFDYSRVQLWDLAAGAPIGAPIEHPFPEDLSGQFRGIGSVAFSPDGQVLLTGSIDGTARRWEAASGRSIGEPLRFGGPVTAVAFRPDGRSILVGGQVPNGVVLQHREAATGRLIDEPIRLVQAEPPPERFGDRRRFPASRNNHSRLLLGPGSRTAFTIRRVGDVDEWQFWDADTGRPIGVTIRPGPREVTGRRITRPPDGPRSVVFSADGCKAVIMGSFPDRLRTEGGRATAGAILWDVIEGRPAGEPIPDQATTAAYSPDGRAIALGFRDPQALLWDVPSGRARITPPTFRDSNWKVAQKVSIDAGGTILAISGDAMTTLLDERTGEPIPDSRVAKVKGKVTLSPDGRTALIAQILAPKNGRFGWARLTLRLIATGTEVGGAIEPPGRFDRSLFRPDGKAILTITGEPHGGEGRLWDARTGRPIGPPMAHGREIKSASFSPDSVQLATGSADATARLWDATTGRPLGQPLMHHTPVRAVAFGPDGTVLFTGDEGGQGQLWDVATCRPIGGPLPLERSTAAAFRPDGRRLAIAGTGGTIHLWPTPELMAGTPEQIKLRVQSATNLTLDSDDAIRSLDLTAWESVREQLQEQGGGPKLAREE